MLLQYIVKYMATLFTSWSINANGIFSTQLVELNLTTISDFYRYCLSASCCYDH